MHLCLYMCYTLHPLAYLAYYPYYHNFSIKHVSVKNGYPCELFLPCLLILGGGIN